MSTAFATFAGLVPPDANDPSLAAAPFPGYGSHRVAKNSDGGAVVLIKVAEGARRLTPLRMENLEVVYSAPWQVSYANGAIGTEVYTSLKCLSQQPSLVRYFFELLSGLLAAFGPEAKEEELDAGIRSIVRLFESLTLPATKSIQGIWAELLLIASSNNKEIAAKAWHSIPGERSDFARGPERLEVKSSSRRERRHRFSLDQVSPPPGTILSIASVFTERSSGGTTLERILEESCENLPIELQTRLRRIAAETLGSGFANALDYAFDRELATASVQFFDSELVPKPVTPLPAGVSEVRFSADLTLVPPKTSVPEGSALLRAFQQAAVDR